MSDENGCLNVAQSIERPQVLIDDSNPSATVEGLRNLFADCGKFYDRGGPVRLVSSGNGTPVCITPLTKHSVIMETHRLCQPIKQNGQGHCVAVKLPDYIALMYLGLAGEWNLPPLDGIATSPLLSDDGTIRAADGYDRASNLWCCNSPELTVPLHPAHADVQAALTLVRQNFCTLPFSDSPRKRDSALGIDIVDISKTPAWDESGFLIALLTACCRSSLLFAPGLLATAPMLSGAGTGKGILVRAISAIAFGVQPQAFTPGSDRQEFDKRLAAELIEAQPAVFIDNANGLTLRSDTLSSVLTERPARIRLLGQTRMVPLNSAAFIALTGNGLTLSEDLARRFISCELDARCEDPESRAFRPGFLEQIQQRRPELLSALLTIWRWGRQTGDALPRGKPLGSFEVWARWCRDPLVALGCRDPVERIEFIKARDPRRQRVLDLFNTWSEHHGDTPVKASQLAEPVRKRADPQGRGRHYVVTLLGTLAGTHAGGFVLTRQEPAGKWTAATYALKSARKP